MEVSKIQNSKLFWLIVLFFLLFLAFPTQNSTIDAYNYAANVKWNHDIFFPHHLLYNFLPFCFNELFVFIGFQIDILKLMIIINAVFAAISLFIFSKILYNYTEDKQNVLPIVFIAGSCFGFMRFATENETYIIPIFWSLLSTNYFLIFIKTNFKSDILLAGIFATIACLFHQIHILWFVGLLIGLRLYNKEFKILAIFIIPSILIPSLYYIAYKQTHFDYKTAQNLWQFVFFDYYHGTARVQFGMDNLILGFISFIRSFIQVHGNMLFLIKKNYLYAFAIVPLLFSVYQVIKYFLITKIEKSKPTIFIKTLFIVFSLQFAFAVFSDGNAEFMVMLPILILLIINGLISIKPNIYFQIGIGIFIWNMMFAIIPNHIFNFQNQEKIIQLIENKKEAVFILSEDVLVQNMIYYKTGNRWKTNIYKSPVSLKQQNKSTDKLKAKIDSCLLNQTEIYTDCIDEPEVMSRTQYFSNNENKIFFKDYKCFKYDSVQTLIGIKYINKITKHI